MEQPTTRRSRTLSLAGAATSIIFVATKHVFCRDESMLACYLLLVAAPASDRTRVCRDKTQSSVATKVCLLVSCYLWQLQPVIEPVFVMTKYVFCRDKSMRAATKLLPRQNVYFWQLQPMIEPESYTYRPGFS